MVLYICPKCKKKFTKKSNYDTHLKNKKPCDRNLIKITENNIHDYITNDSACTACKAVFVNKYSAIRHIRQSCKKIIIIEKTIDPLPIEQNIVESNDTDIKNLLIGINNANNTDDINDIKKLLGVMNVALTALLDNKNKENPIQIKNTNNNDNSIDNSIDNSTNNTINIQVNNPIIYPYGDELKNGFVIDDKDLYEILKRGFCSPLYLIKYMHFNDKLPQFQNMYDPNIHKKYIKTYNGKKWVLCDKKDFMEDLLMKKTEILQEKFEEHKDKESFKNATRSNTSGTLNRFFKVADDLSDERIQKLAQEIAVYLYNNKDVPMESYTKYLKIMKQIKDNKLETTNNK